MLNFDKGTRKVYDTSHNVLLSKLAITDSQIMQFDGTIMSAIELRFAGDDMFLIVRVDRAAPIITTIRVEMREESSKGYTYIGSSFIDGTHNFWAKTTTQQIIGRPEQ